MLSPSSKWIIKGNLDNNALPELKLSAVMRSLLKTRGFNSESAVKFLNPNLSELKDPLGMKGIDVAIKRIAKALLDKETIGVFTDYDVDGVCSAAIIHRFFVKAGFQAPLIFIPDRSIHGYGLNKSGIDELIEKGATLIITADCGTTSFDEVAYAKEKGIDIIITDHHEPEDKMPDSYSFINPKHPQCAFFGEDLCGAGVVFHLVVALRAELRRMGIENLPNLKEDLDLVTMATVADVVSLCGINRILVKEGIAVINKSTKPGISALAQVAGIKRELFTHDIGFILSPRLNAAGRIASAKRAFDLLVTDDEHTAYVIANELHALNRKRQAEEQKVLKEAVAFIEQDSLDKKIIIVSGENWHLGVLGIVASKLVDKFSKPAIVISVVDGRGKGSGRSIEGIDLYDAVHQVKQEKDILRSFGGHKMAVGLNIDSANIESFRNAMNEIVSIKTSSVSKDVIADFQISPSDITPELLGEIEALGPFGEGNPEPVFIMRALEIIDNKSMNGSLKKLVIRSDKRIFHTLWFSHNPDKETIPRFLDIAFTPVRRRINGHIYLYLSIKALSPC